MTKLKTLLALSALVLGVFSQSSHATICKPNPGPDPVAFNFDLSNVFQASNNQVGQTIDLTLHPGSQGASALCLGAIVGVETTTYRSYRTTQSVVFNDGPWQYLQLNDYLQGAVRLTDTAAGTYYPPIDYVHMGESLAIGTTYPLFVNDADMTLRLRVTKRFTDFVPIPRMKLFDVYVTTKNTDPLTTVVYTINVSGNIRVPQTCELDVGQTVKFDFGNISAAAFAAAGPGGKPDPVSPQSHNIAIKCTNIDAQALLTLRLEAKRSNADMMVSDNPDVGFKVADSSSVPLMPNNIASFIPFQLDDAASALVRIIAWPVSVTGQRPADGPFMASGYLRVDYQ
ncbi:fimbrial protein [Pseudomonas sp. ZM23]|uniref:Fimbrial protein n=1 Tax=Pseudomonas triclosanedens TaxID=2961893 RepID=A0ABY6ZUI4_9PSED|nr:fimbrial protein [Pseudomonas triclosanedens]MCP8467030.1 fimbrial protein [Pseudomonas triclosanedens]MCP8472822.1 fimbrial protein [Pseudomonas triclosanedens]MCP8478253.1 fimbrial protein [Pseudomonas triclosanedens]WAI47658.1 fimbrial protein [Pseudomonas triclosanedens]